MTKEAIEEFGERLMHCCRDEAIQGSDFRGSDRCQSVVAKRWRAAAAAAGGLVPATMLIPDTVDEAVGGLLLAADQEILRLSLSTEGGETVYLPVDGVGEMCGWYMGDAWRTWYSKERIIDRDDAVVGVVDDPAPLQDELPMPRRAIEEFGELLVRHVRDVAIQSCDLQLLPHSQTPLAKRWRRAAVPFDGKVPPEVLIPDCVDETLFAFLRAIDQGLLRLSFTAESGDTVDLGKEGRAELAARYMSSGGWRAKYSKTRFFDDFAELSSG